MTSAWRSQLEKFNAKRRELIEKTEAKLNERRLALEKSEEKKLLEERYAVLKAQGKSVEDLIAELQK